MHPQAVKTIFARLYSAWGDTDKKLVLAESWGYDYFKRKETMLKDIRSESFAVNRVTNRVTIFRPNEASAATQLTESNKTPSFNARTIRKVSRQVANLTEHLLQYPIGQQLAKLIKRGPIHQKKMNSTSDMKTQPLQDFFESLIPNERTPDEIFIKPRTGDIK
jgi:hypothetical protein